METLEVRPVIAVPYQDTFGMFRDDPTFADFLAEVEKYRRQGNNIELQANSPHVGVLDGPEVQLLGEVELLRPHTF
jgi:hypothetical protein